MRPRGIRRSRLVPASMSWMGAARKATYSQQRYMRCPAAVLTALSEFTTPDAGRAGSLVTPVQEDGSAAPMLPRGVVAGVGVVARRSPSKFIWSRAVRSHRPVSPLPCSLSSTQLSPESFWGRWTADCTSMLRLRKCAQTCREACAPSCMQMTPMSPRWMYVERSCGPPLAGTTWRRSRRSALFTSHLGGVRTGPTR